jgi:hypothetical protein
VASAVLGLGAARVGWFVAGRPRAREGARFLKRTVEKKVANHKRRWGPPRARGVEADEMLATSTEADPEGTAELYEQLQKVERWSRGLPPEQIRRGGRFLRGGRC